MNISAYRPAEREREVVIGGSPVHVHPVPFPVPFPFPVPAPPAILSKSRAIQILKKMVVPVIPG